MKAEKVLKQLLTPVQVAEMLGLSEFTIYRYIKAGKIKTIKLTPRNFRIEKEELKKFLEKNKK